MDLCPETKPSSSPDNLQQRSYGQNIYLSFRKDIYFHFFLFYSTITGTESGTHMIQVKLQFYCF